MAQALPNDLARGYSIWLIPSEPEVSKSLSRLIESIGKKYKTPIFPPHITLIGSVLSTKRQMIMHTSLLAENTSPQKAQFGDVDQLDEFFRAIFVRIEGAPGIVAANNAAREMFGRQQDKKYMPHLSIMYCELPKDAKDIIIKEYDIQDVASSLNSFTIKNIALYYTNGKAEEWHKVGEFKLKGKGKQSQ